MDTAPFFEFYYNNAEVNSILIIDSEGIVIDVNRAFTNNFGYKNDDIKGKNFHMLFIKEDIEKQRPQKELQAVLSTGQAHDENYVVDNNGHAIWCMGESLLAISKEGLKYVIKDIVNLQAKKQLHLFLKDPEDLLEHIFESSKDIPMMIIDGSMKIQRVNSAFLHLFEMIEAPAEGSRLSDINHPFWKDDLIKLEVRRILVDNKPMINKEFFIVSKTGLQETIILNSKIIDRPGIIGKQVFIIFEHVDISSN
jgi:PAS domain S-box-containing protein